MEMDLKKIRAYAEDYISQIIGGIPCNIEYGSENRSLSIKPTKSVDICGHSALLNFMFMADGEVYFFTLFDQIDLTVENAALAFEASTTTAVAITIDEYLTAQLGAYIFDEEHTCVMIERYLNDMIYLLSDDDSMKTLISRTK